MAMLCSKFSLLALTFVMVDVAFSLLFERAVSSLSPLPLKASIVSGIYVLTLRNLVPDRV